jgi:hypothetical protein
MQRSTSLRTRHPVRVHLPALLDTALFAEAELAALRLDGDCLPLGPALVALDEPIDAALRAAVLAPEAARYDLVAADRLAAWVHGAGDLPAPPFRFTIDRNDGVRTRVLATPPREVLLSPGDVVLLAGLRVTTPLRTALDLARLEDVFGESERLSVLALLALADVHPRDAADLLEVAPILPGKRRGIDRLRACGRGRHRAAGPAV